MTVSLELKYKTKIYKQSEKYSSSRHSHSINNINMFVFFNIFLIQFEVNRIYQWFNESLKSIQCLRWLQVFVCVCDCERILVYLYVDVKTFFVLPDIAQKNSRINKKIIQQGKNKMHEKQIKLILYKKKECTSQTK